MKRVLLGVIGLIMFCLLVLPTYASEQRGGSPGQQKPGGGFVKHLDKDGDNKVSRSEFDGPVDDFDKYDANKDEYLSEDEAPPPPSSSDGQNSNRKGPPPQR
ncbi:MAG: hypothetical protein KJ915_02245 [Candidatus Omnitrophica bacterium]|nr:hypothetical protein [Candidatus Omnitrophota bacterium]